MFVSDCRRLRRRSADCTYGTYQHDGKTCCFCPRGYRVLSHCTATDRNDTECQLCDNGSYMDHPNSDLSCQPCTICNSNANMKVKAKCSEYSNTVCGCLEDHYCDKGDHCQICKPCGNLIIIVTVIIIIQIIAEGLEIAEPAQYSVFSLLSSCLSKRCENEVKTKCTETNNTVCGDATPKSSKTTAIVVPILVIIIIIIVVVVLFIIYKRRQETDKPMPKEEEKPLQGVDVDVDINEYLPEIGEHLSWKVMKRVAQHSGMTTATIDNHEISYPTDPRQQTDGLLRDWYQTQGLYKAYPALIKSLCAIKQRRTADEIKQIVEKGEAKKRDINETGHVQ
ncbi:Tumor necrosis factor receptor superfamily member 6 [Anabarilius grahami]|uniref:Tumor necrosis factor receptor superfamily member 6 n=1 Tax=Anabarilius grahami TaxID=495550 RepID=A0A3N0XW16_ANAGA|nr:Tumor necrosis factor receptor superfamily member 6 [Anabarilius grahami]